MTASTETLYYVLRDGSTGEEQLTWNDVEQLCRSGALGCVDCKKILATNLEALKALGVEAYPHKFARRHTISELVAAHGDQSHDELEQIRPETITSGRILAIRSFGKANFLAVSDGHARIQIYIRQDSLPARDFEKPVIGRSLLPIAQDGVGANNTPESFRSFRVAGIEIGMVRLGCLAERSPQAVGVIVRKCLKQLVERLHGSILKYQYFPPVPPHWRFLEITQPSKQTRSR
jgi:hypothetical protein